VRPARNSGTATVLFTDLVGSTELMARLGDVRYDEVRRDYFARLRQAITAAGGDEVKSTGDGIMAAFTSAVDALSCAVAMQQAVSRQDERTGVPMEIRVGLSLGEVTFEPDDVYGTAVVEAARLVAMAYGGQILATSLLRAVVGTRSPARFLDLGSLELKGLPEPVPACEVLWERRSGPDIPLPSLLDRPGQQLFVGRDGEYEALRRVWKEAVGGQRGVVLVRGEPGVGKTRFALELARAVHADGALVLAGRCDEDLGVPYQPFVEALRHFVDHAGDWTDLPARLGRYRGDLGRLVPDLPERVPELGPPLRSDPDSERYRLFEAVAAWLAEAGAGAPVLLVLDDLHWAAKPTLLLLRHLVRSTEPVPLLVVATYRDSDLAKGHPLVELLADLHREERVERFALSGLDEEAVRAYCEAAAGHELTGPELDVARAVHAETAGNPFFLGEVLSMLQESEALVRREGRWVSERAIEDLGIPEGVREVVGRRLLRLSEGANQMLRLAAVVGPEFDLDVLRAADGFTGDSLLDALEEAVGARLVAEVPARAGRFRFAHALVRATLYDELSSVRRKALHGRVANAVEAVRGSAPLDEYLPALAHHFVAAGTAGDTGKAVEYARRAGDQAVAQLAFEPAVTFYDRALACLDTEPGQDDGGMRGELLLARGAARARSGDQGAWDDFVVAADLARGRSDPAALGAAALGLADVWMMSWYHSDQVRIDLLDDALAAQGDTHSALRARLAAQLASEMYWVPGSLPRRQALAAESVAVARRLGDPVALAACLDSATFAVWVPGRPQGRRAAGEEIVSLAERMGDPELALKGHAWCHIASLEESDITALDDAQAAYERCAEELRQPRYRWYALTRRTMRALLAGDLDTGEGLAREALAIGRRTGEGDAQSIFGCQMSLVWQERPDSEAFDFFEAMRERFEKTPPKEGRIYTALAHLVTLALGAGREDAARTELDRLAEVGVDHMAPSLLWSGAAAGFAVGLARVGSESEMAALYRVVLPYAGVNAMCGGAVSFWGSLSHHLGVLATRLGLWNEAQGHLAQAEAVHEGLGARVWLARTQLEQATLLAARKRPQDAARRAALLAEVLVVADDLGLPVVAQRAGELAG
jgi:class 3 adenylate cyclase